MIAGKLGGGSTGYGRRFEYSSDMYILGALNIYIDVVYMFLYILELLSSKR
jgi:FtsH-binding integral membrane protein